MSEHYVAVRRTGLRGSAPAHWSPKTIFAIATGVAAATALVNGALARRAEADNPPVGRFIEIDGLHIHYIDRGQGAVLVLLHGNASMIEDFLTSGMIDDAARRYRVIAIDRPGYGHTARPREKLWTAEAQAQLIKRTLDELCVSRAIIFGHSRGAQVAVAMGIRYPSLAAGLVLASGYYYPTLRMDALLASPSATPIIGDALNWTIAPLLTRMLWPAMLRKLFAPRGIPEKFAAFPSEMLFRPMQVRANAADIVLTHSDAEALAPHYDRLTMPLGIVAGTDDRLIDPRHQSMNLHRELPRSMFRGVPGVGHMVHQSATNEVMGVIDIVATQSGLADTVSHETVLSPA